MTRPSKNTQMPTVSAKSETTEVAAKKHTSKTSTKMENVPITSTPTPPPPPPPTPTPAPPSEAKPPRKRAAKPAEAPVVPSEEPKVETEVETEVEVAKKPARVVLKPDDVLRGFDEILTLLEQEIARLREKGDTSSVRFLRKTLQTRIRALQIAAGRTFRHKSPSTKRNTNSGFFKPVYISPAIAEFTGLDKDQQHSRVVVFKNLCDYIAKNNLQNPQYRRIIFPDSALSSLLSYESRTGEEPPLTYHLMQSLLKPHYSNQPFEA